MIKHYCDFCGEIIKAPSIDEIRISTSSEYHTICDTYVDTEYHLHRKCFTRLLNIFKNTPEKGGDK